LAENTSYEPPCVVIGPADSGDSVPIRRNPIHRNLIRQNANPKPNPNPKP